MTGSGRQKALEKVADQLLNDREKNQYLRLNWEGYHLLKFANTIRPPRQDKKARGRLDSILGDNEIGGFNELQILPSSKKTAFTTEKSEGVFESLAAFQDIPTLVCFLNFLEFCRDSIPPRPLKVFDGDDPLPPVIIDGEVRPITLDFAIEGIEKHIKEYIELEEERLEKEKLEKESSLNAIEQQRPIQPLLTIPQAKEKNANYYANAVLDVIGREKEKARLRNFLECDLRNSNVAWFQLAGVAGQGKSRLAFDLMSDLTKDDLKQKLGFWRAGFLTENDINFFEDRWDNWEPSTHHLLIFDYVIGREEKIKFILQKLIYRDRQKKFTHKIRILLLERQRWDQGSFIKSTDQNNESDTTHSKSVSNKAEWFLKLRENDDPEADRITPFRFESGVEELKELNTNDLLFIVRKLVKQFSSQELTLSEAELIRTLKRIDDSGRPLYAYLLAQQLSVNQEGFQDWTKIKLLTSQLERDEIRWRQAFEKDKAPIWGDNHPAMKLAVLATIVRTVRFNDPQIKQHFGSINSDIGKAAVSITSGRLNNSKRPKEIYALEPDLLGEWFVLYCFYEGLEFKELLNIAWRYSPKETAIFLQRITQDFVEFFKRIDEDDLLELIVKLIAHELPHEKHYEALANVAVEISVKLFQKCLPVTPNLIVALKHAANSSDTAAMFFLGLLYLKGIGVERSSKKAFELYHQAAEKGNSDAMTHLGYCYEEGNGVVRNRFKAVELYQQAVKRGNSTAMIRLASCYEGGEGITKDPDKAIKLFEQAADQGDSAALINLGNRYEQGNGVEQDWDKAINLYQRAAEHGDSSALINLADRYEQGIGIKQDWDKANDLYQRAVNAGDVKAISGIQNNLLLQNFLGVKNNKTYKNFCWSNSKLPSQAAAPVFDPPIIAGHWEQIAEERVTACLDQLTASFEILGITKNLTGYKGQYARRLPLNFYKDCNLVDIQLYDPSTKDILIVSAVFNTKRAILLTGRRDTILALNRHILSFEGKSSTLDYLQFFSSNILNQHKPYQIITDLNEIPFDTEADQYVIDKIKDSIFVPRSIEFIPRCFEGRLPTEGWEKLEACFLLGNNLYIQTFEVFLNGMISLKEGSCILNKLPILQHEYDGIFRKPLRSINFDK